MRKIYQIELDVTATYYAEVEAESEDKAIELATEELKEKSVYELKVWEQKHSVTSIECECENCCGKFVPEDVEEYKGIVLCGGCIQWAKAEPEDFNYIFRHKFA